MKDLASFTISSRFCGLFVANSLDSSTGFSPSGALFSGLASLAYVRAGTRACGRIEVENHFSTFVLLVDAVLVTHLAVDNEALCLIPLQVLGREASTKSGAGAKVWGFLRQCVVELSRSSEPESTPIIDSERNANSATSRSVRVSRWDKKPDQVRSNRDGNAYHIGSLEPAIAAYLAN